MANFVTLFHEVSGTVSAIASNRYLIENFTYNGLGPDVHIYYDSETSTPHGNGKEASFWEVVDGQAIEQPLVMFPPVGRNYSNAQLVVELRPGDSVSTVKWISVWCRNFTLDFGNTVFPCDRIDVAAATFSLNSGTKPFNCNMVLLLVLLLLLLIGQV